MGGGRWSVDTYHADADRRRAEAAAGLRATASAFDYTDSGARATHPDLNPLGVIRECRNSPEHPRSLPVAIIFDVTGSMGFVPRLIQEKLPQLFGLLGRLGVADVQILFGAVGDANTDRGSLQPGQFESGNEMDVQLGNIWIEGGGGGQQPPRESYETAIWWLAHRTVLDSEAEGRKGYAFIIGDEMPYATVMNRARYGAHAGLEELIGRPDAATLAKTLQGPDSDVAKLPDEPVSVEDAIAAAQAKFNLYFLNPASGTSHAGDPAIIARWRELLGENFVIVPDMAQICEVVTDMIRLGEHLSAPAAAPAP